VSSADAQPWRTELPEDIADLSERTGLARREVADALTLLAEAGAIERRTGPAASVRLVDEMLVPAPTAARLAWGYVRARLLEIGGRLPPALAVLRELACSMGAIVDPADAPTVRASVRDLEEQTAFGRTTVAEALAALESSGVLSVEVRPGRTTRFTLTPAAFGIVHSGDTTPTAPRHAAPGDGHAPGQAELRRSHSTRASATRMAAPEPRATEGAAPLGGTTVRVGEFAGTPIYAPAGTPLVLECDAEGRWTCRVGSLLRLGPVPPPDER
jgi:DNA-binding transcriptional MocR family regulator